METVIQVQILDGAVCFLLCANAPFGNKRIHLFLAATDK